MRTDQQTLMIIIGAGGFAKELIEAISPKDIEQGLLFFDDTSKNNATLFLNQFPLITNWEAFKSELKTDHRFALGLGGPQNRKSLSEKCESAGAILTSVISQLSHIGSYDVSIGKGTTILHNATIANGVTIGKGTLIYHNVQITHDCALGNFCELSPGATLLGKVKLGDYVQVGANATILPGVEIGDDVIIGAGAVVTKNIPSGSKVKGIPAS